MSADLDAVRKAYDDGWWKFNHHKDDDILTLREQEAGAHNAGLTAVVEWAMNRAGLAVSVAVINPDRMNTSALRAVFDARDALLKDLTDNPERKN